MTPQTFSLLTYAMLALAAVVFISLYFVTAGYGQFTSRRWGPALDNRVAWTLMEAPVFFVMLVIWWTGGASLQLPQLVFLLLFEVHYFQRSFVFPWLMAGPSMYSTVCCRGAVFTGSPARRTARGRPTCFAGTP